MKIVEIITKSEPIGGAQMVLFNLVSNLKEEHEIYVIVGDEGRLSRDLKRIGVNCIILNSLKREISPLSDIRAYRSLKKIIKDLKPDIVATHSSKAGYLGRLVCSKLGIPNVFTAHGWAFTNGVPFQKRMVYLILEKFIGHFSDHIITVSEYDMKIGLKYKIVSPTKVETIHNGTPDFRNENIFKYDGQFRAVMVARFQDQKDHLTLFKALKRLKHLPILVDLIGDGPRQKEFEILAHKWEIGNKVNFLGSKDDVATFLNRSDIFILISNYEGLPLSICEAMSCALPIVASDVGGVNEMINDGVNGYLIPKGNDELLSDKLSYLISNPELVYRMGLESRKTFEEKFSIQKMVSATNKYYRKVYESNR